jgi:hypothetical protein
MKQALKDKWVEKLKDGKHNRQRYNLSDGDKGLCVIAVAAEAAIELHIIPDCDMTDRDLLTDEELQAIGLSQDAQFYLSTMNDTYVATGIDKFPQRLINAVMDLPVREKIPLLIEGVKHD